MRSIGRWGLARTALGLVSQFESDLGNVRVDIDKHTNVVPEDHSFWMNDGRKSQGGDWTFGVVGGLGGDAVRSNLMSDWSSVEVIIAINYQGKRVGKGYSRNELV